MKHNLKTLSNKKLNVRQMAKVLGGCPKSPEDCYAAGGSAEDLKACLKEMQ